jgi:plastocyanin
MRTIRLLVAGLTIFAVAACATSTPGWTYAPPSASAVPSADASASAAPSGSVAPSASAAASPTAVPSPTASVAPSGSAAPASSAPSASAAAGIVEISAQNIEFSTNQITVAANQAFQINFANNDAGVPHNVAIKDNAGLTLFMGEIFNGVLTRTYAVEPLEAGTYEFVCSVHPNMVGTLTSQ